MVPTCTSRLSDFFNNPYWRLKMENLLSSPYFWAAMAFASEIIGISPLKSNSIVQLILNAIKSLKPGR
jgi:hypothetical protein